MHARSSQSARATGIVCALISAGVFGASADVSAATATRRVFMMGNSMTDGTGYTGLTEMLKRNSQGINWGRQTGPGWSIYQNYAVPSAPFTSGRDVNRPGNTNPWGTYPNAFNTTWDVLTLQPTDRRLLSDPKNVGTPDEHDEANVPVALALMKSLSVKSPNAQVFIYSRPARRNDVTAAMEPTGETFDYSVEWTKPYVDTGPSRNSNFFTRSYAQQIMPLMRQAQDSHSRTRNMPDVRLIPAGEAYYNIDQMIKAGDFAGTPVNSMLDFYADQSHPTSNLASYVLGLTFFSSITGIDPRGVNAPASYLVNDSPLNDLRVQELIQQAVFDAMRYSGYAGYTTPLRPAGRVLGTTWENELQLVSSELSVSVVPEPATLIGLGLLGAAALLRRRRD